MQRIADDRREIYVHPGATVDDLPITDEVPIPPVAKADPFVPDNMQDPKIYTGDVIAGVSNGEVAFVELIVDKLEDGVIVAPLDRGMPTYIPDNLFSARILRADRMHIFEAIGTEVEPPDVEFDITKLETPTEERPR
ncbi:hypothetical protein [Halorubrum vacuolatum]|uniref:Uncharacterized protein n=1 Tax=Halorubrum vacuolatum TaxID=63740 RepID=A0A238VXV5_HALVU|nr:hypothetical protein [Halorubrum vacuolatum]SNR39130.1 hypothetical protein SAMN06264855_104203 [Halorubrum vacuolatum]